MEVDAQLVEDEALMDGVNEDGLEMQVFVEDDALDLSFTRFTKIASPPPTP